MSKHTHALVRFRKENNHDDHEIFKLPTPTNLPAEAAGQWEKANEDRQPDEPKRSFMDLSLMPIGSELVEPSELPKPAKESAKPKSKSE